MHIKHHQDSAKPVIKKPGALWYIITAIGLTPIIGIPFAIINIIISIIHRRFKFCFISLATLLPNLALLILLFFITHPISDSLKNADKIVKENELADLVIEIEMYNINKKILPNSICDLSSRGIKRSFCNSNKNTVSNFYYIKHNNKYRIGFTGSDGLVGTNDDIRPLLEDTTGLSVLNAKLIDKE